MAIAPVSNAAAAGTTVTMPSHSTGNLILASVWRNGSTVAPTIPGGWTAVRTGTGTTSWMGVYAKIAASGSETTGTWTSATAVEVNVYSGTGSTVATACGASSTGTGTGTTITYPAVTLNKTDSTSWVYRTACAKAATNITTNTPTGYTARGGVATTASAIRGCDSNAGLSSSPGTGTQTVSGSGVWIAQSVEILAFVPPGAAASTFSDDFNTGSTPDVAKWTIASGSPVLTSGKLDMSTASIAVLNSAATYDLTGDSFKVQSFAQGSGMTNEFAVLGAADTVAWDFTAGNTATPLINGTPGTARTHTAGDWYRIREASGTLFLDYSANGTSFTNQMSGASTGAITNVTVQLTGIGNGGAALFDNLNITPSGTPTNLFFTMF